MNSSVNSSQSVAPLTVARKSVGYKRLVVQPVFWLYALLIPSFLYIIVSWEEGTGHLVANYWQFFVLGLIGALVANSTGAGGGVVFIPFFSALGMSPVQAVATSMAIQSCGMTAGSFSWLHALQILYRNDVMLRLLRQMLLYSGLASVVGMLIGQYLLPSPGFELNVLFKGFSISFGVLLILFTALSYWRRKAAAQPLDEVTEFRLRVGARKRFTMSTAEKLALIVTCLLGAMVTAWISVGVGEFVALLLFFLRFPTAIAVAIGVFTSSIAVLTGVIHHGWVAPNVSLEILVFAGQAALIGGYLARYITQVLGAQRLKLFFAVWIIVSALFMK